eukprot:2741507-Rhodomonas_salina.1
MDLEPGGGTVQVRSSKQFRFAACFPFVEAVCLHCSKAVPPGLSNSAAYEWMICHLNGYGKHAYTPFPEKCTASADAFTVQQHCRQHSHCRQRHHQPPASSLAASERWEHSGLIATRKSSLCSGRLWLPWQRLNPSPSLGAPSLP